MRRYNRLWNAQMHFHGVTSGLFGSTIFRTTKKLRVKHKSMLRAAFRSEKNPQLQRVDSRNAPYRRYHTSSNSFRSSRRLHWLNGTQKFIYERLHCLSLGLYRTLKERLLKYIFNPKDSSSIQPSATFVFGPYSLTSKPVLSCLNNVLHKTVQPKFGSWKKIYFLKK